MALRYAASKLIQNGKKIKVLILISDGLPNHFDYGGSPAYSELSSLKNEFKKKGVHLVAAAIGQDKNIIESIYGDAFMDISDPQRLPVILTKRLLKIAEKSLR